MYGVVPIENSASGAEFQETPEVDRVKLERTGCYISYIDLYRYIYIEVIYIYQLYISYILPNRLEKHDAFA